MQANAYRYADPEIKEILRLIGGVSRSIPAAPRQPKPVAAPKWDERPIAGDPDAELRAEVADLLRAEGIPENAIALRTAGARLDAEARRLGLI